MTELLSHANRTRGYGIKYISIGNEPDPLVGRERAANVRAIMVRAGAGAKPLALTEMNLAYVGAAGGYLAGSILGTLRHALWLVDSLAQSA